MYNANNYGYNPYGTYMPQRPMEFQNNMNNYNNVQPKAILNGEIVESEDIVKTIKIPLDGSTSYFPLLDGSEIITKQLQSDGTSKITIFKPVLDKKEENKYITQDDLKKAIDGIYLSEIDDIKEDIKEIKKELKKKGAKNE